MAEHRPFKPGVVGSRPTGPKPDIYTQLVDLPAGRQSTDPRTEPHFIRLVQSMLLSRVSCREVYSPLGSQLAGETLRSYGISYQFTETVPFIQNQKQEDMCPMEKLSLGKAPEDFYQACLSLGLCDNF